MNAYHGKLLLDTGTGQFQLETAGGGLVDVVVADPLPELGRVIEALVVDGKLLDWQYDLTDLTNYTKRVIDIAVGYGVSTGTPITQQHVEIATRYARDLENELRRVARDRWEVNAYPAAHAGAAANFFMVDWGALSAACREAHPDAPRFTHFAAIAQSGMQIRGACGQAALGGTTSFSKGFCASTKGTHIHEAFHSIAMIEHASQGDQEYGEGDTWMGNGDRTIADLNTPHLYQAGLIENNNIVELLPGDSVSTWLVQGSDDPMSLRLGENKAVLCHVATTGMTRKIMVAFYNRSVRVYEPGYNMTTSWMRTKLRKAHRVPGESVHEGVKVIVHKIEDHCAEVSVLHNTTTIPARLTAMYARPSVEANPQITDSMRGQWGNKKWSVQGVHVSMTNDGRPVLHWLTWDRWTRGAHRWFWAVCNTSVDGRLAYGSLITADRFGRTETVGYIEAYWYTETLGIMRGYARGQGRFAIPLERVFAAVPHDLAGYYGIGNGQGLTLSLNENGRALSYWLLSESSNQVWHMLIGELNRMTIYRVTGGQLSIRSSFDIEPIGIAEIYIDELDENKLKFKYTFIDGITDTREMNKLA